MGTKTLRFPKRKKYIPSNVKGQRYEVTPVSEDEHKKRIDMLKSLGLIKEER